MKCSIPKGSAGIYRILNRSTGKSYIGSACDIYTRFHTHLHLLKKNTHHSPKLQHSWSKHGQTSFDHLVLEIVQDTSLLANREQHWMDAFSAVTDGYNHYPIARSSVGRRLSDETKNKISKKAIGRKVSDETKRKLSVAHKGRAQTPAQKKALALANTGRVATPEQRLQMSLIRIGVKRNPIHVEKTAAKLRGRKQTKEQILNSASARTGLKRSDDARKKMSAAQKNRFAKNPKVGVSTSEATKQLLRQKAQERFADPILRARFISKRRETLAKGS